MKLSSLSFAILAVASALQPEFTAYVKKLSPDTFLEQFNYKSLEDSKWHPSKALKESSLAYTGQWSIEPPSTYPGYNNDNGLVMKSPASHYGISYKFDQPFDNTNKPLVLQYEVKTQNGLKCGGAYIKLLSKDFDSNGEFNNSTPFQLMFGPDKCGAEDKIHFILNKRNPITNKYQEKHLVEPPITRSTQVSVLYTLVLHPNSDFEIRINGNTVKAGNLLNQPELMNPPLSPPKEKIDVLDIKPDDWEDLEFIADESISKPDEYDLKFASPVIPDPNVEKPKGWLDDEPEYIQDPIASKPSEWDDEEDGQWEPPVVKNPKCMYGCGKWEAPLIPNINYKGPWVQPVVKNPNYKGEWQPKTTINPEYYEDKTPSNLELIGGLGFELWTIENDILFDNIYLGSSIEEAEILGNKTFIPKLELEYKDYEINKPKPNKGPEAPPKSFDELIQDDDDNASFAQIYTFFVLLFKREFMNIGEWWYDFNHDPLTTLTNDPLKAMVYAGIFVFGLTFVFGFLNIIVYMFSTWATQTKLAVDEAARKVQEEEIDEPKIVEIREVGQNTTGRVTRASRKRN